MDYTIINAVLNLRETRNKLEEKYQKGIITSDELHLLYAINQVVKEIAKDIKKQTT